MKQKKHTCLARNELIGGHTNDCLCRRTEDVLHIGTGRWGADICICAFHTHSDTECVRMMPS